jgi:uncharacterized protein YlxW (UPF0749 family)
MKTPKWAIFSVIWCSMGVFGVLTTTHARPEGKKYDLSENQKLRLQVKQKDAQLAQIQLQIAQSAFQKTIDDFNSEAKAIEKENSWPETLQISPQTLEFHESLAAPKPLEAPDAPAAPPPEKPAAPTPAAK